MSIAVLFSMARSAAHTSVRIACELLMRAGLDLNMAARYVFGYLRACRRVA